jgi:hypothetical protein
MKKYLKDLKSIYKLKSLLIIGVIISFLIILIDIQNIPTKLYFSGYIVLLILVVLILLIKEFSNIKNLFFKHINIIDKYLIIILFASIFISIYEFIFDIKIYKLILLAVLFLIILICYGIRFIKNKHSSKEDSLNVIDLKYIYIITKLN